MSFFTDIEDLLDRAQPFAHMTYDSPYEKSKRIMRRLEADCPEIYKEVSSNLWRYERLLHPDADYKTPIAGCTTGKSPQTIPEDTESEITKPKIMSKTNSSYPKQIRLLRDKYPSLRGDIYTLKYERLAIFTGQKYCGVVDEIGQDSYCKYIPCYVSENGDSVPAGDYSRKDWFEVVDEVKQTVKIGEESYELTEQQAEQPKEMTLAEIEKALGKKIKIVD